jgi:hypothetical protein
MTDTQLRFLRAIADRVPLDRLAEVHLFPAMRQGITETGIAVVAARQEGAVVDDAPAAASEIATPDVTEDIAAALAEEDSPSTAVEPAQAELALVDDPIGEPGGDPTEAASMHAASTQPPDEVPDDSVDAVASDAHEDDVAGAPVGRMAPAARGRHTVFSARYRMTIKGPERGRWEVDVVEEADAPLLTVEMVVRGVQRRSGEGADPERLDAARLRELLAPAASA